MYSHVYVYLHIWITSRLGNINVYVHEDKNAGCYENIGEIMKTMQNAVQT